MNAAVIQQPGSGMPSDAWSWWQARRLRYNLGLGGAGLAAYTLSVALYYAFGHPLFGTVGEAASQTLFLGTLFLLAIGVANLCYLLGPFAEMILKPADPGRYRSAAFGMGFWGSFALPFAFTLSSIAFLIADSGGGLGF